MELLESISVALVIRFVVTFFVTLAAFLSAVVVVYKFFYKAMQKTTQKMLADEFAEMNKKIDDLKESNQEEISSLREEIKKSQTQQEEAAIEACKNFLTHALVDVQNGADDEVLKKRIHDAHDWYHDHGQNSYIDARFNKLVDTGKL